MSRKILSPLRAAALPLAVAALALGLGGCSASSSGAATGNAEPSIEVGADTVVLDVRTPEEFDSGHLEGARLIDFNAGEVEAALPELDPDAEYLVYCRSGNRSGQAVALMERAGFTNVTNLGSVSQAASATGLPTVTG